MVRSRVRKISHALKSEGNCADSSAGGTLIAHFLLAHGHAVDSVEDGLKIGITVRDPLHAAVFAYEHHCESARFDTKTATQGLGIPRWYRRV